jgi:hypothetical protein
MATPHRLFISYSRVDLAFALKLAKDLGARGFTVWIDEQAIPAGANWDVQVEEGIRKSDCVLAILSPASVDSQQVRDEVLLAMDEGKRIIPILYQPCEVPMKLRRLQRVDFTASYEQGLARLINEVSPSRPLPVMPGPPARKGRAASLGVTLAGLVLMTIVYALVFGLPSRNDETGRQIPPSASVSRWTPGQPHPTHPHVKAGLVANQWVPEDGYAWLDSRGAGDFRVKWMPGIRHRQHPYVYTSEAEGRWSPAPGYKFANPDDPNDLRVTPLSPVDPSLR